MSLSEVLKLIDEAKEALDRASPGPSREKALTQTKLDEAKHWIREIPA
jgi:hypothetical protein